MADAVDPATMADSSAASLTSQLDVFSLSSRFIRVVTAAGEAAAAPPAKAAAGGATTTVVVANLEDGTTAADVAATFAGCGDIAAVRLATDRETGAFRGFGHVDFCSPAAAAAAVALAGAPVAAGGRRGARACRVEPWEDSVVDAVERGDAAAVAAWFATGACDVDDRSGTFPAYPRRGWPLLARAARNGDVGVARFLVGVGADVALETDEGRSDLVPVTPLHVAIAQRRHAIAALLLDAGVDVDARLGDPTGGRTPLMVAALNGDFALMRLFLRRGADLDAVDDFGFDVDALVGREMRDLVGAAADPAYAAAMGASFEPTELADIRACLASTAAFLAEIRAAGGWRSYVLTRRAPLFRLRVACARRGAAAFAPGGDPAPPAMRGAARILFGLGGAPLPAELFRLVVAFLRS